MSTQYNLNAIEAISWQNFAKFMMLKGEGGAEAEAEAEWVFPGFGFEVSYFNNTSRRYGPEATLLVTLPTKDRPVIEIERKGTEEPEVCRFETDSDPMLVKMFLDVFKRLDGMDGMFKRWQTGMMTDAEGVGLFGVEYNPDATLVTKDDDGWVFQCDSEDEEENEFSHLTEVERRKIHWDSIRSSLLKYNIENGLSVDESHIRAEMAELGFKPE